MESDTILMQEIFKFVRTGSGPNGSIQGHFQATGIRPRYLGDLAANGINVPNSCFDPGGPASTNNEDAVGGVRLYRDRPAQRPGWLVARAAAI